MLPINLESVTLVSEDGTQKVDVKFGECTLHIDKDLSGFRSWEVELFDVENGFDVVNLFIDNDYAMFNGILFDGAGMTREVSGRVFSSDGSIGTNGSYIRLKGTGKLNGVMDE